ncbi:interferon alpha/beta receptor 1a-like isoform X1 [Colossoma macropomum]|uniref:interferon alpha/beta receptor 1a-like isoform X1 n=1 Tax=Colossoma macropomum TaxID=42526 RepID=UPI0018641442|nr:interferon alpha/beta receptor 1a-like isoform X1 [Colossoma macropomum]
MPLYLHVGLNLLVLFSASASLSSPYDVRMIAVDLNYTLQWAWSDSQLNDSVNFTAAYAFWNIKDDEGSYKQACAGSGEHWCDFTHCKLHFKGSFQTRVRAEAAGRHSNWTHLRFTPDEHVLLGPPSEVNMQGDVEMVILNISKSVMNSLMKVQYEVQYWEQQQPDQKHLKIYNDPYAPLTSLKPWTEYCLQVRVFNKDYSKNSSFTSPRCVSTTGRRLVWLKVLTALCCILLLGAVVYMCCRLRRKISVYQTPNSILCLPLDHPPLLEAQELRCSIVFVSAPTPRLESPQLLLQEQDGTGEFQAVSCQGSNGSEQDSGIGSGEES